MSSDDLNIQVEGLGKRYEIYARPADRLKQMIFPRVGRMVGKPDLAYFNEFWALRGVSFVVRRGETMGIIGRNGSGKSTLLQMICGTLHPTEGMVCVQGRIAALLELGAGFNPEFTGRENVYLSGLLYGISERALRERYQSIVEFAEIGDFINQPVKTYSSGMYVRLAFAIAAHVDADTLVIDEALSVGDIRFTQKCMRYLREFQKRGTLLFVSHDAGAVMSLCSRAIWLDAGHMVMDGSARDVVERYLAEQHAADRASLGESVTVRVSTTEARTVVGNVATIQDMVPVDVIDPRKGVLNGEATRNIFEIFEFDAAQVNNEFGAGSARIVNVQLLSDEGRVQRLTTGGEVADLVIEAEVLEPIEAPIFGFYVKDRLGQRLFGDNTYVSYRDQPVRANPGERLRAHFRFRIPVMPSGDYSIDVALATGSQEDHTQQHWIHDVITFRTSDSTMRHGLVGVPMHAIEIEHVGA
jgi:lipopolysaccharide transport system ATP-binding protein